MCTNPIQIYNRSSQISYRGQALIYTVPCGQCEECKKLKSNEYTLRSYFEYKDCISRNGYVYFDTLTYNNKHLPKHYGIYHFRRSDIVSCLKKLRVYLTRAGFVVKDNLKYFITSEYGGKTHRPHYHVLFFITIPNLDVATFWEYLNKAWIYGFIDRKSNCASRIVNSTAAINYVAKYVQKDQEWQNVVDAKLSKLRRIGAADKLQDKLKDFSPFHLQSEGYGACFTKYYSIESIMKDGFIQIPDRKYLIKNYAIPTYYKRKLFYYYDKDSDGKLHWHLNDLGKKYKVNQIDNTLSLVEKRYKDITDNLKAYSSGDNFDLSIVPRLINKYLDGRTLRDFATYVMVYRHKLYTSKRPLPSYKDFYKLSLEQGTIDSHLYDDNLAIRSSFRSRLDQYKITQYRYHQFRDFDNLYLLFKAITNYLNVQSDKETKRKQEIRDRLKLLLAS